MRKKTVICILSVMALLACSCGKNDEVTGSDSAASAELYSEQEDENVETETDETETASAGEDSGDTPDISDSVAVEQKDETDGYVTAEQCRDAYMAFLNNEEKLYFDGEWMQSDIMWNYSTVNVLGQAQDGLTLSEMTEKYLTAIEEEYQGAVVEPQTYLYAFPDCGNDGIPELAFEIEDIQIGDAMTFTDIFVIKLADDGRLELCFWDEFGYESYGCLTQYGEYVRSSSDSFYSDSNTYRYINGDGDLQFIYDVNTFYAVDGLWLDAESEAMQLVEELGDDVRYMTIQEYTFEEYPEDTMPEDIYAEASWTYYPNGTYIFGGEVDQDASTFGDGTPYRQFWDATGFSLSTYEEISGQISAREKELGVTDDIKNAEAVSWTEISEEQKAGLYSWRPEAVATSSKNTAASAVELIVENPGWEYYNCGDTESADSTLELVKTSEAANNITDEYEWFAQLGLEPYDSENFYDDNYRYELSTTGDFSPYLLYIYDKDTDELKALLNMCRFYYPETYAESDVDFIGEGIRWAQSSEDGTIIYVCTSHRTYASSASQNAYITAIKLNDTFDDYTVLWKSEPLVANAYNFVTYDDFIICGYGFTAEPDYLYVLDRNTGEKLSTYPVKTGPDYFYADGSTLYVRTYDMNYEYEIKEK